MAKSNEDKISMGLVETDDFLEKLQKSREMRDKERASGLAVNIDPHAQKVLILDFGSQYTQLIARRIRELSVYCEIHPYNMPLSEIEDFSPKGIILSGGPASVYQKDAPLIDKKIFELGIPVLGICYGLQLISHLLGGEVRSAARREYGYAPLMLIEAHPLFDDFDETEGKIQVWMSHGDVITNLPEGFKPIARSPNSPYAAIGDEKKKIYGLQFHPEVAHTVQGSLILKNFLFNICGCEPLWTPTSFIEYAISSIKNRVNGGRVVCALSGGVDSSVVAVLTHKAIGDRLTCIFVDNGLLRAGEKDQVISVFRDHFHIRLRVVDAEDRFLSLLRSVKDPEKKRKIIGHEFINIFEEEAKRLGDVEFLAQGTLYPDVIESVSFKGPSATIKTHHNVGGLPERMKLALIEPLRELFKDEVRKVGIELGLPEEIVYRHPFPGPGLAIRIIGEVTRDRLSRLRKADAIVREEIKKAGFYRKLWQAFAVLLPIKTVGVMGDERTYEEVIAVRAVDSVDAMTADWSRLPHDVLATISNRIINEVKGINRVVYDLSSKPPSTIEWE